MKKIIPFTKEIEFKTMISKITSISLEHTLRIKENNLISGHFILEGTYKMTQASQIDEEFSYKIPVDIEIDEKYDTTNVTLDIDDFTYEIIDEERIKLNISLSIDNIEEKDEIVDLVDEADDKKDDLERNNGVLDDLFLDMSDSKKEELIIQDDYNNENNIDNDDKNIVNEYKKEEYVQNVDDNNIELKNNDVSAEGVSSLFASFKDSVETFKTYYVYIVKEEDTLDSILKKYGITKEELSEYNNLDEIKSGSKVVIPNNKNE